MKTPPLVLFSLFALAAPRPTQQPSTPELVQDGVISTARNETWPSVDPVDGSLWFSIYDENFDRQTILRAPKAGDKWGTPAAVSFSSGTSGDRAPRFSPDGKRLYFSSNRSSANARGFHIWVVERRGQGWSDPVQLPAPVTSTAADMHSSETRDGDLFFFSTRSGANEIFRSKRTGNTWSAAELLPPTVNAVRRQTDILVAPDGSWMLVVVTGHPKGLGGDDLFLSRRVNGVWAELQHLPAPINSSEYEYGPSLSPDGKTLYFTSHRRGSADVYRVPVSAFLK
jgi:Tol biopolymer transport system component